MAVWPRRCSRCVSRWQRQQPSQQKCWLTGVHQLAGEVPGSVHNASMGVGGGGEMQRGLVTRHRASRVHLHPRPLLTATPAPPPAAPAAMSRRACQALTNAACWQHTTSPALAALPALPAVPLLQLLQQLCQGHAPARSLLAAALAASPELQTNLLAGLQSAAPSITHPLLRQATWASCLCDWAVSVRVTCTCMHTCIRKSCQLLANLSHPRPHHLPRPPCCAQRLGRTVL